MLVTPRATPAAHIASVQIFLYAEAEQPRGLWILLLYMCLVRVRQCVHARADVEVRGQLAGIGSFLPVGPGG